MSLVYRKLRSSLEAVEAMAELHYSLATSEPPVASTFHYSDGGGFEWETVYGRSQRALKLALTELFGERVGELVYDGYSDNGENTEWQVRQLLEHSTYCNGGPLTVAETVAIRAVLDSHEKAIADATA